MSVILPEICPYFCSAHFLAQDQDREFRRQSVFPQRRCVREPFRPVDAFTYLGGLHSSNGCCRTYVKQCIALASYVMSSLDDFWRDQRLSFSTKTHNTIGTCPLVLVGPL